MFELTPSELNQSRLLTAAVLICGLIWNFVKAPEIQPQQAVPAGKAEITIGDLDAREISNLQEHHRLSPDHIFLNEATIDQLVLCPGIGSATAQKILLERAYGNFADWRDVKDRVKGMTQSKIEKLQEAGVRLDR